MIYSLDEIDIAAKYINDYITENNIRVVCLDAPMGAGKTTLVKAIVALRGSSDETSSPTYSIVNEYLTQDKKIYHIDLYRIENLEEAQNFGIEEYLYANELIFIEWPEIIKPLLEEDSVFIGIEALDEYQRKIVIS